MYYPQHSNHRTWHTSRELWPAFATQVLRNQAFSSAQLAECRLTVGNSLHPSKRLSEMTHPSVTFVGSPLPLQQGLSGTIFENCGKNDEGMNFGFGRMAQMMRHLPTRAEILSFTLPDLIYGSWRETQLVLSYLAMPHQRKGKLFKVTLMQPAAGETET